MKPYRYPPKIRPDVAFTTWRRNLSYVPTHRFLHHHVISRAWAALVSTLQFYTHRNLIHKQTKIEELSYMAHFLTIMLG